MVLELVVADAGIPWFSFVGKNYSGRGKKDAKHYNPFDNVVDTETGVSMNIRDALVRIEDEVRPDTFERMGKHELSVYADICEKVKFTSRFVECEYGGIFRNKGVFRRAVRWSAMDELATAFVSKDALALWNSEGYVHDDKWWSGTGMTPMEFFREGDKLNLSEKEFDRISQVFKRCLDMCGTTEKEADEKDKRKAVRNGQV